MQTEEQSFCHQKKNNYVCIGPYLRDEVQKTDCFIEEIQ